MHTGSLISSACAVIRPQLSVGTKTICRSYGEIFLLAWTELSSEVSTSANCSSCSGNQHLPAPESSGVEITIREVEDAVQGFLRTAVHAADRKYFSGLRHFMRSFHDVKRTAELDGALLSIYDPILWRSLRCASGPVRSQAAVLFLDVFPLQHPGGSAEEEDLILQKQFDCLMSLLTDSDQQVRAHTALGVCHILRDYWAVLPSATTHRILTYLAQTLAVDASSADVRVAVFAGLGELVQQPLAHEVLKHLLPLMKNAIHDKAEKVRVAFVKILCQVCMVDATDP